MRKRFFYRPMAQRAIIPNARNLFHFPPFSSLAPASFCRPPSSGVCLTEKMFSAHSQHSRVSEGEREREACMCTTPIPFFAFLRATRALSIPCSLSPSVERHRRREKMPCSGSPNERHTHIQTRLSSLTLGQKREGFGSKMGDAK